MKTLHCRLTVGAAAILILLVIGFAVWWATRPTPRLLVLIDGTVVRFLSDSHVRVDPGYPHPRVIHIDGDVLIKAIARAEPLTVLTRLLHLTINGKTALHIAANSHETGEQVEVLYGDVIARKNFPSNYTEPDHLSDGEMSMVNQTIDLMEKEKLNASELANLSAAFARFDSVVAGAR
jgi:ferric-dicitrate binding protein FerR (iron transport regulator)